MLLIKLLLNSLDQIGLGYDMGSGRMSIVLNIDIFCGLLQNIPIFIDTI